MVKTSGDDVTVVKGYINGSEKSETHGCHAIVNGVTRPAAGQHPISTCRQHLDNNNTMATSADDVDYVCSLYVWSVKLRNRQV
jgi:hypothetical protein